MRRRYPPTTTRYCMFCKCMTTFRYDRGIGHSRCIECGWHHIPTLDINHAYDKEKEEYLKIIEEKKTTPEYQEYLKTQEDENNKFRHLISLKPKIKYKQRKNDN